MKNFFLIITVIISFSFMSQLQAQHKKKFSGHFSSEGDVIANGIITMELIQSGIKIEGVSDYKSNDGMLRSGLLSVNGYLKGNKGYIRFRDQKGNNIGDGSIVYQDESTLYFRQTTKSPMLPTIAYIYKVASSTDAMNNIVVVNYSGKYSNEGDIKANGIISLDISQKSENVEGVATYKTFDQRLNTGILSVDGYVKEGIAYIRFIDQRGSVVANGALSMDNNNVVFRQTTLSNWLPHYAVLYK
ncbi:hypothetical protein OZ668_15200 [Elizabethkingia sp. HX XZB]|uniref:hypothetical protein n=1 Tax=Elizabethkingia sp. HX XZB TaxID=3003193 RepID=UPI002A24DD82|nr:hypothetical protein [Elizabethkingia sp. HX XZB]MDX8569346.1 hypothetical protein [Elizabethkingia sp. HX XZB]